MAKAIINLQKESGGIVKISPVDGIGVTEVTVPESGELATKEYADLKVALESFTGANQSLAGNGYQKLPGGLIIQWGINGVEAVTFPIAFPTNCSGIYTGLNTTAQYQSSRAHTPTVLNITTTGFTLGYIDQMTAIYTNYSWLAIGY